MRLKRLPREYKNELTKQKGIFLVATYVLQTEILRTKLSECFGKRPILFNREIETTQKSIKTNSRGNREIIKQIIKIKNVERNNNNIQNHNGDRTRNSRRL